MKKPQISLSKNESGIVSVTLTIFVMIMLTLTVLAFSQISRREQREVLDRQISTQALYAAESGINEAVNKIRRGELTDRATECLTPPIDVGPASGGTSVPCLLYDAKPEKLEYANIDKQNGKIIPLETESTAPSKSIKIDWNAVEPINRDYTACPTYSSGSTASVTPLNEPCDAGYLRATIITTANGVSREALYENSFTVFFKPSSNSGATLTVSYAPHGPNDTNAATQGRVISGACSQNGRCQAEIKDIPIAGKAFLHIRSIHKDNSVTITNAKNNEGFIRAQIMVDSTGKVSDVLRRVQARVSYYDEYEIPSYAVEGAATVCKRLRYHPGINSVPGNAGGAGSYVDDSECGGLSGAGNVPSGGPPGGGGPRGDGVDGGSFDAGDGGESFTN